MLWTFVRSFFRSVALERSNGPGAGLPSTKSQMTQPDAQKAAVAAILELRTPQDECGISSAL